MDILRQFGIIIALAFAGEILHVIQVRETVHFLIETMPIMFVPAAAGLIDAWALIRPRLFPYLLIILVRLLVVMVVSGLTTQFIIRHQKKSL